MGPKSRNADGYGKKVVEDICSATRKKHGQRIRLGGLRQSESQ